MKYSLLVTGIIISSLLICGCTTTNSNTSKDTLSSDKYVAVYEEYTNSSKLIGDTTYIPFGPWPIPMPIIPFDYNNSSGVLISHRIINSSTINDSFKILYGRMNNIDNPNAYGQSGVWVTCVYMLPYTNENGFTIMNISRNGTIYAIYNNESIYLKPGDTWSSLITTGTTMGSYSTLDPRVFNSSNGIVGHFPWPVSYNTSFTIENKGIYNKALLNSSYK